MRYAPVGIAPWYCPLYCFEKRSIELSELDRELAGHFLFVHVYSSKFVKLLVTHVRSSAKKIYRYILRRPDYVGMRTNFRSARNRHSPK